MSTTRRFVLAGAGLLASGATARAQSTAARPVTAEVSLDGAWLFRLDAEKDWRTVRLPHTWQVDAANAEYYGMAWYRRTFDTPRAGSGSALRIEFEAVRVNGQEAGEHARRAGADLSDGALPQRRGPDREGSRRRIYTDGRGRRVKFQLDLSEHAGFNVEDNGRSLRSPWYDDSVLKD